MIKDVKELAVWPEIPKDVFEGYKNKGDSTMDIFIAIMDFPSFYEKDGVSRDAYDYNKLCNSQKALLAFDCLYLYIVLFDFDYCTYFETVIIHCKRIFNPFILDCFRLWGAEKSAAFLEEGIILYDTYKDEMERLKEHTRLESSGTYQMIKEEFGILGEKIPKFFTQGFSFNDDSEENKLIEQYVENNPSKFVKIIG